MGTNGEGILLTVSERRRAAELFVEAAGGRIDVAVHCGAQSTADTAALAAHAAEIGADAVAVIAPPYFPLDEDSQLEHLAAAAAACAPLPFYVYEFAMTSGYAVSPAVVDRLRERAPNLAGLKVSDRTYEELAAYLGLGLDVFVGFEAFIGRAMGEGAVGAVSALASAFPEIVAAAVRGDDVDAGGLRAQIERYSAPRGSQARARPPRRADPRGRAPAAPGPDRGRAERLDRELEPVLQVV